MSRCLLKASAALCLTLPAWALAQSAIQGAVLSASQSSTTTTQSNDQAGFANPAASSGRAIVIPANSLRGEIVFSQPPDVTLNGQAARLAPGARIRDTQNLLVLSGNLIGQKWKVNYTVDTYGLLMGVWLLTANEAAQLWPKTAQEAATWAFDPVTRTWAKP
jgi:hypothetical protein